MSSPAVPFMITQAAKEALRHGDYGLSDDDIQTLKPEEVHKILLAPNPRTVRKFLELFTSLAEASLGGHPAPGFLQLSRIHPSSSALSPRRYGLGDLDDMIAQALDDCANGFNAYVEARFVKPGRAGKRGCREDTVAVFALIIDSDADTGKGWSPPPRLAPTLSVETSPGNRQFWFFLKQAISAERAEALGVQIRKATRADSATGNPVQPYRIAGTINYPNQVKLARGRVTTWTRIIDCDPAALWTLEELEQAFPLRKTAKTNKAGKAGTRKSDGIDEASIAEDALRMIREGVSGTGEDRSIIFYEVVETLKWGGFTLDEVVELLARYPEGIARKYAQEGKNRLREEVRRAYGKIPPPDASTAAAPSVPASPPPGPASPPAFPPLGPAAPAAPALASSLPQPLIETHAVFRKWLGKDYELPVLDTVLAAAAANKLGGDPLWLIAVAGSGNAKTETVQSLAGAGAHVTSTISSEGALLAATPRSRGSTGGLLYKIGVHGLLVIKDFTSILSAHRVVRDTVLAALREIYDGKWERNVGYAGGRTLTWRGRITVIAACTTAWDSAYKVISTLGDRFAVTRANSMLNREAAALQAIENTGREDAMRAELALSVGGLIASVGTAVRPLRPEDRTRLIKLADIVTWTRTGIERDFRGDVVDAHAWEMPTRFAKQLSQLMRGALALGIETDEAMQLVTACARDSIEPRRFVILLDVAHHPDTTPDDVAKRVVRPLTTVKNDLVALYALHLLTREERDAWGGGRLAQPKLHYTLTPKIDRKVLLSML